MKYALFHWYQGEGNKYTYLGEISEEEYLTFDKLSFNSFVFIKCHTHSGGRELIDRVYFDKSGNSYTSHKDIWKQGYA